MIAYKVKNLSSPWWRLRVSVHAIRLLLSSVTGIRPHARLVTRYDPETLLTVLMRETWFAYGDAKARVLTETYLLIDAQISRAE